MAAPATTLLAGFDFDLTSHTRANPAIPRPPTPDPRRTPTPHPPRRPRSSLPSDSGRKRLRKKPTAIFVGSESITSLPAYKPCPSEAKPFYDLGYASYPTLPSLLPLLPSTPSPRFATSPSLSSSGTTVQSSPTLTPTTAHFESSYIEPQPDTKDSDVLSPWDNNQGKFGLRRAKRLPRREQGLWEVHAVVHVGEESKEFGSGEGIGKGQRQHEHYEWCMRQQRQAGLLGTSLPHQSDRNDSSATATRSSVGGNGPVNRNDATVPENTQEGFHGIYSESSRREGGLRKTPGVESSSFSLSKYHFPAPPGDYRIGLSGE